MMGQLLQFRARRLPPLPPLEKRSEGFDGQPEVMAKIVAQALTAQLEPCKVQDTSLTRDQAILRIRQALKRRSGKAWSVTGGSGTAWAWIRITVPPSSRVCFCPEVETDPGHLCKYGKTNMSQAQCAELAQLLGLEVVHNQGVSIPAGNDYRIEYVDRAEGLQPRVTGKAYWD
jgi:hypothetical protein